MYVTFKTHTSNIFASHNFWYDEPSLPRHIFIFSNLHSLVTFDVSDKEYLM